MAVAIYFNPATLSEKQYRAATDQLASQGDWPPAGLVHHSCFGEGDSLMVYEVWDSQAALDAFGARLMPVLKENNIDPGQPMVMPVVNVLP